MNQLQKMKENANRSPYRIHPVLLAIVAAVALVVLVGGGVLMSRFTASAFPANQPTSSSPIPTPPESPESTTPPPELTVDRVIAFESAWLISDVEVGRNAIKPYVSEKYLASRPAKNSMKKAAIAERKLTKTIDPQFTKVGLASGKGVMRVSTSLHVTVTKGEIFLRTSTIRHATTWILQPGTETWVVDQDR